VTLNYFDLGVPPQVWGVQSLAQQGLQIEGVKPSLPRKGTETRDLLLNERWADG